MFFGIFDIFPNLLTTGVSTLFPIFASYKALRTADPAQLTPWLMYWVVFTIAQTAEYWFSWLVDWVPFYSWFRFGAYFYLVAPGMQGAPYIYQTYVHPFLSQHEAEIDRFISDAHDNLRRAGISYLNQAIEYVKVNVLGFPPRQPTPPPSRAAAAGSYAQNLLSRFHLPAAREGLAAPAGDFYGLISGALQGAAAYQRSGGSRDTAAEALSASGTLIPEELARGSPEERRGYVTAQRDRLQTLIQAFDREASTLDEQQQQQQQRGRQQEQHLGPPYPDSDRSRSCSRSAFRGEGLTKSRSELEFDRVEYDEALAFEDRDRPRVGRRPTSGSWMPWGWGASGAAGPAASGPSASPRLGGESPTPESRSRSRSRDDRGRSTGNDLAY